MSVPSICVFCGARSGNNPAFSKAAQDFGAVLGRENWRLVFGAGDVGLMGELANAAQAANALSLGVIPTHLMTLEKGKRDVSTFIITSNMHERKKIMFMNSDAIVVLPGGAGSLDEFFEVLTWAQIGLHNKPIFLANIEGYWQPLIAMIDHMIDNGFAAASLRDLFTSHDTIDELTEALRTALPAQN